MRTHLYLSELMRAWFYFSYMEAKSLPEKEKREAVAAEQEIEDILFGIIEQGIADGTYRPVNARLVSSLLKALLQDWYLKRGKYHRQGVGVDDYAAIVMDVLDSYMLPASCRPAAPARGQAGAPAQRPARRQRVRG